AGPSDRDETDAGSEARITPNEQENCSAAEGHRMNSVRRMVRWFEKEPGETLIGEAELRGIPLPELQSLFGVPPTNPMYDCCPVHPEHILGLLPYLTVPVEL